ncbi:MAG: hypothetical protein ACI8TQ_002462 [Planctomycetota bacterium]|jgi:hypothetical protein
MPSFLRSVRNMLRMKESVERGAVRVARIGVLNRALGTTVSVGLLWCGALACSPSDSDSDSPKESETAQEADPLAGHEFPPLEDSPDGRWRKARQIEGEIDALEGIGYASGYKEAPVERGVTINTAEAHTGYNFYVSGHGPEAVLMDMAGVELHRWRASFDDVFPNFKRTLGTRLQYRDFWRRAYLYPNGDILAIFEGHALIKLDRNSEVLWTFTGLAHHDLEVTDDGRIYLLTRKGKVIPRINPDKAILEDFVVVLDSSGKRLEKISIYESFENSKFEGLLKTVESRGDLFHTNTIEVLDGSLADRNPAFARGNVLVSILRMSTVVILDMNTKKVVWALSEGWKEQHQPTMLENGEMMVFDNLGGDERNGRTRVIQFDPIDYRETWSYEGDADNYFQSDRCGSCQRLPGGNTLITESDNGRAFEVTPDKRIVWEFLNPSLAGDDESLIATLFEVVRLSPDFPVEWADGVVAASNSKSESTKQ